jgi:hypothetical protein
MNRRLAIAGVVLAGTLSLAGCGLADDAAAPAAPTTAVSAPPVVSAEAELAAAATKLGEDTARIDTDLAGTMSMTGVVDPAARKASMTMTLGTSATASTIRIRKVGDDMYLKIEGALSRIAGGGKWLHLDVDKVQAGSTFDIMPGADPTGARTLARAVTAVRREGGHGFVGMLDMTKARTVDKNALKALGAEATTVPFTATTDDQGRLTSMNVDMSGVAAGMGTLKTRYSDFGTPVDVRKPPAAQVTEAPDRLTGLLNA